MKRALFVGMLIFIIMAHNSWAQIPGTLSYQGMLTDGSGDPVGDGNYELSFSIYDVDGGSTALWTEFHASVAVVNGAFNVILGSITPLDIAFDKQYWLGIAVAPNPELTPRIPLTSSAYSLNARTVADGQVVKSINALRDDVTLVEGANVTITSSDNILTISATGGTTGWGLSGNAGTDADVNFLGTTDEMPLALRINNLRGFLLLPSDSPSIIGGFSGNSIGEGLSGITISGGGEDGMVNSVTAGHGTIGGGKGNTVNGAYGTIGGGWGNSANSDSTVGGGGSNTASGVSATVPGGAYNTALGAYSFAAGRRAKANHDGSFVWGDSVDSDVTSTIADQFVVRANGGVRLSTGAGGLFLYANSTCPNIIGGFTNNAFGANVVGASISGGGVNGEENIVTDNYGTIGGGRGNQAGDNAGDETGATQATVSGGLGNIASGMNSVISGGWNNNADGFCATISGGGRSDENNPDTANRVTDDYGTVSGGGDNQAGNANGDKTDAEFATVSGGDGNTASGRYSTVGGGSENTASADYNATIGGGERNAASENYSTVSGGGDNTASGRFSTVGGGGNNAAGDGYAATISGGFDNTVSGSYATVCGGNDNTASGNYSFAAGSGARATHEGSFVWSDSSPSGLIFGSLRANQFRVLAQGGARFDDTGIGAGQRWVELCYVNHLIDTSSTARLTNSGIWTDSSDAALKENFIPVDSSEVLQQLVDMPISTWNHIADDPSIRHMGPTAQDFSAAYGLGEDERHIASLDTNGVALAAIQGLYELVKEKDEKIATLEDRIAALEALVSALAQE